MSTLVKLSAIAVSALLALPASAIQRTFVASFGNDANACTLTSPCRGFTRALTQTDANGEVIVLDSAGYGTVTITQAVSIIAPEGIYAGITVFTGNGVTVNPGDGDKVVLRGLTLNGQGGGPGIRVLSGKEVHIERCTISNMTGIGIQISNAAAVHVSDSVVRSNSGSGITVLGGTPSVFVNDSRFVENGQSGIIHQSGMMTLEGVRVQNNAGIGLVVNPDLTTTRTRVRNSQFSENQYGIRVSTATGDMASVTVEGSAAFNNSTDGISVDTLSGGAASVVVSGSVASGNGNIGIGADGSGASVFVTGSTITGNAVGLSQANPASLSSLGNNMRRLNGTDSSGTIVTLTLQ